MDHLLSREKEKMYTMEFVGSKILVWVLRGNSRKIDL